LCIYPDVSIMLSDAQNDKVIRLIRTKKPK